MKKLPVVLVKLKLVLIFLFIQYAGSAQSSAPTWARETAADKEKRMQWWTHDRFGMFIHWGLYALPARHEWVQNRSASLLKTTESILIILIRICLILRNGPKKPKQRE